MSCVFPIKHAPAESTRILYWPGGSSTPFVVKVVLVRSSTYALTADSRSLTTLIDPSSIVMLARSAAAEAAGPASLEPAALVPAALEPAALESAFLGAAAAGADAPVFVAGADSARATSSSDATYLSSAYPTASYWTP